MDFENVITKLKAMPEAQRRGLLTRLAPEVRQQLGDYLKNRGNGSPAAAPGVSPAPGLTMTKKWNTVSPESIVKPMGGSWANNLVEGKDYLTVQPKGSITEQIGAAGRKLTNTAHTVTSFIPGNSILERGLQKGIDVGSGVVSDLAESAINKKYREQRAIENYSPQTGVKGYLTEALNAVPMTAEFDLPIVAAGALKNKQALRYGVQKTGQEIGQTVPKVKQEAQSAGKLLASEAGAVGKKIPPAEGKEPWQMTKGEATAKATDLTNREDFAKAWTPIKHPRGTVDTIEFTSYQGGKGVDGVLRWNDSEGIGRGILTIDGGKVGEVAVQKEWRNKGIASQLYKEAEKRGVTESKGTITPAAAGVRHKLAVKQALAEGKPVPAEVLADYPELAAKVPAAKGVEPFKRIATPEEVNAKTWYHGSKTAGLKAEDLSPDATNTWGLFGHGVYLTDDPKIAGQYAINRSKGYLGLNKGVPTSYKVGVSVNKVLDMEKVAPAEVRNFFSDFVIGLRESLLSEVSDSTLDDLIRLCGETNTTSEQIYKQFMNVLKETDLPTSEFVETVQEFTTTLRENGYDAMLHTGGKRVGKGQNLHNVLIVFDPNDAYSVGGRKGIINKLEQLPSEVVTPKPIEPPPQATTQATQAGKGVMATEVKPTVYNTPEELAGISETTGSLKTSPNKFASTVNPDAKDWKQFVVDSRANKPPFGQPGFPSAVANEEPMPVLRNGVIAEARETVRQDTPGKFSDFVQEHVPVVNKLRQKERPALGWNEDLRTAIVAENKAGTSVNARLMPSQKRTVDNLKEVFGNDVVHGTTKLDAQFLGTADDVVPFNNTLLDVVQRADLYALDDVQKAAIAQLQEHGQFGLSLSNDGFGAEIGNFRVRPDSAFLSNVKAKEPDGVKTITSEWNRLSSGRSKERFYETAADRWKANHLKADPALRFEPELDVEKLINIQDMAKAKVASGVTFREVIGGKTLPEVLKETHPKLYARTELVKKRLLSLQGMAGRLDANLNKTINKYLSSAMDDADMLALSDNLEPTTRAGLEKAAIDAQIADVKAELASLRKSMAGANKGDYVRPANTDIYKYFTTEEANAISESQKVTNTWWVNQFDRVKATAFGGDLSPITIQGLLGAMADPYATAKYILGHNPLKAFSVDDLVTSMETDPDKWARYFELKGYAPKGVPSEYAGGFLAKLKGYNKANESLYVATTKLNEASWEHMTKVLMDSGMERLEAEVAASHIANTINPLATPSRLGQPVQSAWRSSFTSYSFIRQPATLMAEATRGYVKLGLKKTLTARENLAVRVMTTLAASVAAISVTSSVINAIQTGKDPKQAALDAINPSPSNGKFLSVMIGNTRIPMGGPYRGIFRAVYPGDVSGVPIPVPFAGIWNFGKNRINPAPKTVLNLVENKDYYGNEIRTGDFPEQVVRGVEYAMESAMPLTVGSTLEGVRTGQTASDIIEQTAGQFAGVNLMPPSYTTRMTELAKKQVEARGDKWAMVNQDAELIKAKQTPEGQAIIKQYAKTGTKERNTIIQRYSTDQTARDGWLDTGVDEFNKQYTVSNWKDDYYNAQSARAAQLEQFDSDFKRQMINPKTANDKALSGYYNLMDSFSSKVGGGFDGEGWAEAESNYMGNLTPDQKSYVQSMLHLYDTPKVAEFRKAKELLAPYWRLRDNYISQTFGSDTIKALEVSWNKQKQSLRLQLSKKTTNQDYISKYISAYKKKYFKNLLAVDKNVGVLRDRYKSQHPDVALALRTWYSN
jgi:GNAT superfamily N-acetyltransferase/uncharacterized protein YdbL (DUF1318 family)